MANLLEVDITGIKGTQTFFNNVKHALLPDDIAVEAGAILLNRMRTRFLDETDPDGIRWKQSRSARKRASTGKGGGTLFDTGALFHSIQLFKRGNGIRAIGSDLPYAVVHQKGVGQEKREFLGFSTEDGAVVERLILNRLDGVKRP
ncbi:MAG: phage virion morphogenesis protein [Chlamydiia bacterium]|nr:phage virion morphogenesis protein [Chlamydiia bacterium]